MPESVKNELMNSKEFSISNRNSNNDDNNNNNNNNITFVKSMYKGKQRSLFCNIHGRLKKTFYQINSFIVMYKGKLRPLFCITRTV
jgi:hypothetical protein